MPKNFIAYLYFVAAFTTVNKCGSSRVMEKLSIGFRYDWVMPLSS
jgi:hypothetical protein